MTIKDLKKAVRTLIGAAQFEKAFELLEHWVEAHKDWDSQKLLTLIQADFNALKRKRIRGVLSFDEERRTVNDITDRLLALLDTIAEPKKSKPFKNTAKSKPPQAFPEMSTAEVEALPSSAGSSPESEVTDAMAIEASHFKPPAISAATIPIAPAGIKMNMPVPQPIATHTPTALTGGLLYHIPPKMPQGVDTKCIVRIAFDKTMLKNNADVFQSTVEMEIRASELMEVELKELGSQNAFEITPLNDKQQFLDGFSATEWQFYVKPVKIGSFKLLLKVAIIERINDVDRRKEAVLEQAVTVITEGGVVLSQPMNTFMPNFQDVATISAKLMGSPSPVSETLKTILFMGANPPGTSQLQLEVEHSRIVTKLEGKFRFPTAKFVSASDIPELIIKNRPNMLHFSGHGKDPKASDSSSSGARGIGYPMPKNYEKTGGIVVFDNDMRGLKIVENDVLEYIFDMAINQLGIPLEVVVFNSCHSESQAKVLGKHIPYVIGTARAIQDDIAIAFATGFYFGIANGLAIEKAFTSGKMQAVMADFKAKDLIVLYKKGKKTKL
jgi:Effector-associated domain 11